MVRNSKFQFPNKCQTPISNNPNVDEFVKSQKNRKNVMLNLVQHPCLRQAGNKINDLRDPEIVDPELDSGHGLG
jgi:hypothetical protein